MNHYSKLPKDFLPFLEGENINFIIAPKKNHSKKGDKGIYYFYSFLLVLICGLISHLVKQIISTDIGSALILMIPLLFLLIIATMFVKKAIKQLFESGGYFVGTDNSLIHYRKGEIAIKKWKNFSGHIHADYKYNEIELLTPTQIKHPKEGITTHRLTSETTGIYGIDNMEEILQTCRNYISNRH